MGKNVLIDNSGPPLPMLIVNFAAAALAAYEVGWADLKPSAEKALKPVMKAHSIVCATGFVPMCVHACGHTRAVHAAPTASCAAFLMWHLPTMAGTSSRRSASRCR